MPYTPVDLKRRMLVCMEYEQPLEPGPQVSGENRPRYSVSCALKRSRPTVVASRRPRHAMFGAVALTPNVRFAAERVPIPCVPGTTLPSCSSSSSRPYVPFSASHANGLK